MNNKIIFYRNLGIEDWSTTFKKMNDFNALRNYNTFDEVWFVEHYPIFTQGQSQKKENIVFINQIPVVNTDRGGQITYHGPGQQILYFLIDLKRRKMHIRNFIDIMQKIIMITLSDLHIQSQIKNKLPGVYAHNKKICSIGLRITKGFTLHGLSLNVNMDLEPFNYIHPCGEENINMTQIKDFYPDITLSKIRTILIKKLSKILEVTMLNYNFYNIFN